MNRKQRRQAQRNINIPVSAAAVQDRSSSSTAQAVSPLEHSPILIAVGALLIALCTWIIYGQTVRVPPIAYDDYFYLTTSPYVAVADPLSRLSAVWDEPYFANYHPVTTTTWLFDRALSDKAEPFHAITFRVSHLLYAALGALLLLVLYRRLGLPAIAAVAGAVLYAVHPVHTEVLAWLSARKDITALIFVCLSMLSWLRAREAVKPWQWRSRNVLTILLVMVAVLAKPIAVIVPVLFVAYEFCSQPHAGIWGWRWSRRHENPPVTHTLGLAAIYIPIAAAAAFVFRRLLEKDPAHGAWPIAVLLFCAGLIALAAPNQATLRRKGDSGLRRLGHPSRSSLSSPEPAPLGPFGPRSRWAPSKALARYSRPSTQSARSSSLIPGRPSFPSA